MRADVEADDAGALERPVTSARGAVSGRWPGERTGESAFSRGAEPVFRRSFAARGTVCERMPAGVAASAVAGR
ncbi:hypothetical protein [Streptomyces termitum]|uniref:Uncharacterized protein n=1 Tax=Streptomyces termitum TaxID=67368 RepID=A0A918SY12_9ACTN|nr:hypothetical protein [Streptomyces termitum]GHA77517.1 hypothetical protein GCM10010305_20650 [Streptomyces termitum]